VDTSHYFPMTISVSSSDVEEDLDDVGDEGWEEDFDE